MITRQEIDRYRDLATQNADAMIDTARSRVLVLYKAPRGAYSNVAAAENIMSYLFWDGQSGSGLIRGDLLRGRVWGTYASDSGGLDTDTTLILSMNGNELGRILITRGDLGGDTIAFDCDFVVRVDGVDLLSRNNPAQAPSTTLWATINARFGNTDTTPSSVSQSVTDSWITSTSVDGVPVSLAIPLGLALQYEGTSGGLLTIYGGMLEGL